MKSYEIIYAMGNSGLTSKQLEIALRPYIDKITYEEVCNFVIDGVYDFKERIVAFVLGLKKYIPDGWKPTLIKVKLNKVVNLPIGENVDRKSCPKTSYSRWTKAEIEEAIALHDEGMPHDKIADKLDRAVDAVKAKIYKCG